MRSSAKTITAARATSPTSGLPSRTTRASGYAPIGPLCGSVGFSGGGHYGAAQVVPAVQPVEVEASVLRGSPSLGWPVDLLPGLPVRDAARLAETQPEEVEVLSVAVTEEVSAPQPAQAERASGSRQGLTGGPTRSHALRGLRERSHRGAPRGLQPAARSAVALPDASRPRPRQGLTRHLCTPAHHRERAATARDVSPRALVSWGAGSLPSALSVGGSIPNPGRPRQTGAGGAVRGRSGWYPQPRGNGPSERADAPRKPDKARLRLGGSNPPAPFTRLA